MPQGAQSVPYGHQSASYGQESFPQGPQNAPVNVMWQRVANPVLLCTMYRESLLI